ncbi:hypothetical protein Q73_00145 [Bacillus coahuilensis m2-6]|uniref:YybS family protein n=1 Tax=Bacillus coahuilensis TaxID=408580 RepID=UPI0007503EEB|nr:YybS family protein [Bacillus coahuilensis]KUP09989.1 hypothetical protein Q73_00145 [Bacillus coahuilensis m2-6]
MKSTKALTEGAMMAAFTVVLLVMAVFIPVIAGIGSLFIPLPALIFSSRYSLRHSISFLFVTLILSFMVGNLIGLGIAISFVPLGILLGYSIQKGRSKISMLISSTLLSLVVYVGQFIISIAFLNFDVTGIVQTTKAQMETFVTQLTNAGVEFPEGTMDQLINMVDLFVIMIPAYMVMMALATAFLALWINIPIAKRFGVEAPKFPPFKDWMLPRSLIWYYLIALLLTLFGGFEMGSFGFAAVLNVRFLLELFFILQGLSFLYFFSYTKQWNKAIPITITVFLFLFQYFFKSFDF